MRAANETSMAASKIMLIRHGEKADGTGATIGVAISGREDPRELSVRGWQRAGAIAVLFGRVSDLTGRAPALPVPTSIYAARSSPKSNRSLRTVELLAASLSITIDASYGDGDEADVVSKAVARGGTALIAWKHDGLPVLAGLVSGGRVECPSKWPDDRFDVVWLFERANPLQPWRFSQVPQLLLPGDRADPIR